LKIALVSDVVARGVSVSFVTRERAAVAAPTSAKTATAATAAVTTATRWLRRTTPTP